VWTHLRRINKYDVPGHEMNADCTHVCVCPLTDGEEGVQRFFNQPLKLFRTSKASGLGSRLEHDGFSGTFQEETCRFRCVAVHRRQRRSHRHVQASIPRFDCSGRCLGCDAVNYCVATGRLARCTKSSPSKDSAVLPCSSLTSRNCASIRVRDPFARKSL
jgi:hypothetical protein